MPEARWRVGREMRRRITEALETGGIAAKLGAGRVFLHPPIEVNGATSANQTSASQGSANQTSASQGSDPRPAAEAADPGGASEMGAGAAGAPGAASRRPGAGTQNRRGHPDDHPKDHAEQDERATDDAVTSAATTPAVANGLTESGRGDTAQ
jgi:hypothetical protein